MKIRCFNIEYDFPDADGIDFEELMDEVEIEVENDDLEGFNDNPDIFLKFKIYLQTGWFINGLEYEVIG